VKKLIFLGSKLRNLREAMGWSTFDVERKTGLRQSIISGLENGHTKNPRPDTVRKLCEGLKVNDEFFYLEDATLPTDLLPDMPDETKRFIMSGDNIPYIVISERAKREGIPPQVLQQMLDLLICNRNK
jgi:transcriptional regulator with XRE-family HTH domain